jgi:DNA-binding NarL/FixJ family response regulator
LSQSICPPISVISNNHIFKEWFQFYLAKDGLHGDYFSPDSLKESSKLQKNNIFLIDIQRDYMDALELILTIKKLSTHIKIIAILEGGSESYLNLIFKSNIDALIASEELSKLSLQDIVCGFRDQKIFISEKFKNMILNSMRISNQSNTHLTHRELQIINFLGHGQSTLEIAELLCCSPKTINVHRSNIKEKLKIRHNHEFIKYCFESTR